VQLIIDFTENNYIYSVYIHSTVSYTHPSFIFCALLMLMSKVYLTWSNIQFGWEMLADSDL